MSWVKCLGKHVAAGNIRAFTSSLPQKGAESGAVHNLSLLKHRPTKIDQTLSPPQSGRDVSYTLDGILDQPPLV